MTYFLGLVKTSPFDFNYAKISPLSLYVHIRLVCAEVPLL